MTDNPQKSGDESAPSDIPAIGGPVRGGWCEWTLARAGELEALSNFWVRPRGQHFWVRPRGPQNNDEVLTKAICSHLDAARQAATNARLDPPRWFRFRIVRPGSRIERARINLDAAEAHLLTLAPNTYILGQMPCLLNHVQRHLPPTDARRQEFERIPPLRGGSFRRVLRTQALRRGGCRARHPVTGRLRSPPYPAAAPASTPAGPSPSPRVCRSS